MPTTDRSLRVCSYEDRPEAMDSLILMGESLCRADPDVSLHLTVPGASSAVTAWAAHRPEVTVSTHYLQGVGRWDVKPSLLLQELDAGWPAALWLDSDMIITRPVSRLLERFPRDCLIVAEEWGRFKPLAVSQYWNWPSIRLVGPVNSCVVRARQTHRPLLKRWLQMTGDERYRAAQALPLDRRPVHLISDQWLLNALLEGAEFGAVPFDSIRADRDIAQCAGSSGYRPLPRVRDLFRGLPTFVHCIGRKPWIGRQERGRVSGFLVDLATDVSPYILAARGVARDLGMKPPWLDAHTWVGASLRGLTGHHPGLAGLPLAFLHALHMRIGEATVSARTSGAETSP